MLKKVKKLKIIFVIMLTILIFTFSAFASEEANYSMRARTVTVEGENINISALIEEVYDEELHKELFEIVKADCGECYIDTSKYILEYQAEDAFIENLMFVNENGLNAEMFEDMPHIDIPVFSRVDGAECITGCIYLKYDEADGKYIQGSIMSNIGTNPLPEALKYVHDFDESTADNLVFINLNYWGDQKELILLVETDGVYTVHDFSNTVYRDTDIKTVYSLEEYANARKDYMENPKGYKVNLLYWLFPQLEDIFQENEANQASLNFANTTATVIIVVLVAVVAVYLVKRKR